MPETQDTGRRVLFAGGGTGGHVFPALAVATELRTRGWQVMWAGREDGMERGLVVDRGVEYHSLQARRWVGQGLLERASALVTLASATAAARRLILKRQVQVTVGTGGFVSVPAVVASFLARRPTMLLEPNARAGMANRWLSRLSKAACIGYEETSSELSCPSHWTGIPVREEFFQTSSQDPVEASLLVVGGSQGALQINELLPPVVERLGRCIGGLRVVHQVGQQHRESVAAAYRDRELGNVKLELVAFIDDMASAMRDAQIIISRAGALTLAEIVASGRPSVLIPLGAAGGHQRENAERLLAAGAAEVLGPDTTSVERLETILHDLLTDHDRRRRMAASARSLAKPQAAARIADLVETLGRAA